MNKNEELQELKDYFFDIFTQDRQTSWYYANEIQSMGYTKSKFDVKKLEKIIGDLRYNIQCVFNRYIEEDSTEDKEFNRHKKGIIDVLDKIKELE